METQNKIKVLLLNPPTAAVSKEPILSLAYLATSLRKAGHIAKIVYATAPYNSLDEKQTERVIADFQPTFIGVTLTIDYIPYTYVFLNRLRKMGIPIVAGGPHASALPEEVLKNGVDIVVIGEGEDTVSELADYFSGKIALNDINGICFKDTEGKVSFTAQRKLIENIDSIPFPDFSDFPIRNYTGREDASSNPRFWSIFSSRGCPFNCTFCSSHNVFGRSVRFRSPENILHEINNLAEKFGARIITFQDDEILSSKKRFLELCDLIIKSGLKIKMSIRTRINSIDREILLRGKEAGLKRISFGIESWNDETLAKINKGYNAKLIHEKFKMIAEVEFPSVSFNIICGWPWENGIHYEDHYRQVLKIPQSIAYFTGIVTPIPYPKTKLYDDYYRQFGFVDWWLNPDSHLMNNKSKVRNPFFKNFAFEMTTLYFKEMRFWHYPKRTQKDIDKFSWRIFKLFLRRHLNFYNFIAIFYLCRLSHFLWKMSPTLESILFYPLRKTRIVNQSNKVSFIFQN